MKKGVHCIRGGFNEAHVPSDPHRFNLDNGDFETNMKIQEIQLINTGCENGSLDPGNSSIFVQVGISAAGATPVATSVAGVTDQFGLDLTNTGAIAWATWGTDDGWTIILDPDHIVPEDLYINAWTITTGGGLSILNSPIGYHIEMKQVKSTGTEALLQVVKQTSAN